MNLTMILPALNWPHDTHIPELDTPYLNQILRFAKYFRQPLTTEQCYMHLWHGSLRANMMKRLGLPEQTAAVLVSPLWQKMGMHSMNVLDGQSIGISAEEAQELCRDLNRFYEDAAYRFYPYRPDLWLMTLPERMDWTAVSVFDIHGQVDGSQRAEGKDAAKWLALQTEMQMWLHQHEINRKRSDNGQPPINGVWLWQDAVGTASDALVVSDCVWASEHEHQPMPVPERFADWLAECRQSGISDSLVFLDSLVLCRQSADVWRYSDIVQAFDQHIFRAVWQAVASGCLNRFTLITDGENGGILKLDKRARWKWWRKRVQFSGSIRQ